ncbi:hypothetical protein AVEN_187819-1 [Araneus ventricosus]|uniref:Uncharacterized protein n=1 Tax=Araneus ventricosus TaxID=182803 RepID=A0A4Y2M7N9_ARAVE|nr:hypothetical protein AVEN_187819-1 [Araneus ventricosus]
MHVANKVSIQAAANPRNSNRTARHTNAILLLLYVTWIKAHVDYEGNEISDTVAKKFWIMGSFGIWASSFEAGNPYPLTFSHRASRSRAV